MPPRRDPKTGRFISQKTTKRTKKPSQKPSQKRTQKPSQKRTQKASQKGTQKRTQKSLPQRDNKGRFVKRSTVARRTSRDNDGRLVEQWRRWSKQGFPDSVLDEINEINIDAGRPAYASFGFRAMYHKRVLHEGDEKALAEAENDT